jgi:hypothetical protein
VLSPAPKWKANVGWDLRMPFDSMPFDGQLSGTYLWVGEQNFSLNRDAATAADSYGVMNLSISIRRRNNRSGTARDVRILMSAGRPLRV